jgi:NADH-quinone oxidoreductase subunit M
MMLGIYSMTVQGIQGGILYMISSGLTGGGLFLIVAMLEHRRARRGVDDFGGLAARMPLLFFLFMVMSLGAIGLPGLNGFPAEFLVITGAIRAGLGTHPIVSPWYGYLAGLGVVLSAVYMLWMFQRVMYGEAPEALRDSKDLDRGESFSLWPIVAAVFFIGIGSAVFTEPMLPAVQSTIESVQQGVPPEVVDVPGNDLTPEGSIP